MKKFYFAKKIILVSCIIFGYSFCGCAGYNNNSDSQKMVSKAGIAELGIHAFGTKILDSNNQGHAFLSLKNISESTFDVMNYPLEPGREITISYWPDSRIRINHDALNDKRNQDGSYNVASLRMNLSESELNDIIEYTVEQAGTLYDSFVNNCTTYVINAWNMVNKDFPLNDDNMFSIDAPKWTKEYINKEYSEDTIGVYTPDSCLTNSDLFMTTSKGNLLPLYIDLDDIQATVDKEKSPCNIDLTWKKSGKVMYDEEILINKVKIRYLKKNAGSPKNYLVSTSEDEYTIANLEKRTTYLVQLCPVYECDNESVEGKWSKAVEATTGGEILPQITFTYDHLTEIGTIEAIDTDTNELVWTYSTLAGVQFQFEYSSEIGLFGSQYYIQDGNDLLCFDAYTGDILWKKTGAISLVPTGVFDEDGNLYLAFYLSDLIIEISPEGEILHSIKADGLGRDDTFWAYEIKLEDGALAVHYEGNNNEIDGQWLYLDIDTWTIRE